jgi:hypothetical protein
MSSYLLYKTPTVFPHLLLFTNLIQKNENPPFYETQNRGILIPVVDFEIPPPKLLAKLFLFELLV